MKKNFQYIYGPVPSWRLGRSLGIDPLSQDNKICSFNCLYCQLGKTKVPTMTRNLYVSEVDMVREIRSLPQVDLDYITFSGRGEPTLALNLGMMIAALKDFRPEPIAVITNSSLLGRTEVREELSKADLVICKLDAYTQKSFELINQPLKGIELETVLKGIKEFKKYFPGKFVLQVMFLPENIKQAKGLAGIAGKLNPDEIQINTPLRPCGVEPVGRKELLQIKDLFKGPRVISVYESRQICTNPISNKNTLRRRGKVGG